MKPTKAILACLLLASCAKQAPKQQIDRRKENEINALLLQVEQYYAAVIDNEANWENVPIVNIGTTIDEVNKTLGDYLPVSHMVASSDGTYEYSYISNGYEYIVYTSGEGKVVRAKRKKIDPESPWYNSGNK